MTRNCSRSLCARRSPRPPCPRGAIPGIRFLGRLSRLPVVELLSTSQTLILTSPAGSLVPAASVSAARNTVILGPAVTLHLDQSVDIYADYKLSLGLGKSIDHNVFAGARWSF